MSDEAADREHPAPEMLSAYLADELSPEENDAVQEHVASCDLCAERLLDLQRFLEFAPDSGQEGVVDLETAAEWRQLRQRLELERIPPRGQENRLRRALGSPGAAYGLAALLAFGLVGLSLYTARLRQELREPEMNTRQVFLPSAVGTRGPEDEDKTIDLAPQEETRITLKLDVSQTESYPAYRLEVRDPEDQIIVARDDLRKQEDSVIFTLPTAGRPAGRYSVEIRGLRGDDLPPTAVGKYAFIIRRP